MTDTPSPPPPYHKKASYGPVKLENTKCSRLKHVGKNIRRLKKIVGKKKLSLAKKSSFLADFFSSDKVCNFKDARRCSLKKVFLEISQNSQTPVLESLF